MAPDDDLPFPAVGVSPRLPRADMRVTPGTSPIVWRSFDGLADYVPTVSAMEALATAIRVEEAPEAVWLLEHPPLYTAGTSAREADLIDPRFPVHHTGRGGQFTYHGPGQRVVYVMLDLTRRRQDVRAFVEALEDWLIDALDEFGVRGGRRAGRVGVWVSRPDKLAGVDGAPAEDKIAAIGLRLRRWVSFHGVALNVAPDLGHFGGIAPCGVRTPNWGVTSLADLGVDVGMAEVDAALRRRFEAIFGMTVDG